MKFQLTTTQSDLDAAVNHLAGANPLAVDMEMENNLHHYGLHLALVQIATPANAVFIFDTVLLEDLKPLGALLTAGRHELIMHGAGFDRRTCFQLYGWILVHIFDTQIAAMFCGIKKTNLADLLNEFFGVKTDKRFQRQDWLKRPLAKPALEYAAKDVNMLHSLREHLIARLIELKRLEWAKEETAFASRNMADDNPMPGYCRVKRSIALTPRQLAVLKSLYDYRERTAKSLDRPAQFVIRDLMMIEMIKHPPRDEKAVRAIKGVHPRLYHRKETAELLEAIQTGMKMPEEIHPAWCKHRELPTRGWEERLQGMRAWRLLVSGELNLEPYLVFDSEVMIWCARHPGRELPPFIAGRIRNWQKKLLWPEFQKKHCSERVFH